MELFGCINAFWMCVGVCWAARLNSFSIECEIFDKAEKAYFFWLTNILEGTDIKIFYVSFLLLKVVNVDASKLPLILLNTELIL